MKFLKISFLSLVLFITSFFEVAVTKNNLTNFYQVTLHLTIANASSYTCPADYPDGTEECNSLKQMYDGCNPDGSEELHRDCEDKANTEASNLQYVSSEEDFSETYGPVEAKNISSQSFWGLMISLIAEIVSGGIRLGTGSTTVSAWIHFSVSSLLFLAIGIMGLAWRDEIKGIMEDNKYVEGSSYGEMRENFLTGQATELKGIKSDDPEFVKIQESIIDDNIEILELMAKENNHYNIATKIGSGLMLVAAGFAYGEIAQCAASVGSTGCTYQNKNNDNKYYALLLPSIFRSLMPNAYANEDDNVDDTNFKWGSWITNAISGTVSVLFSTGVGEQALSEALKKSAEEAAEKAGAEAAKEAGKKAATKAAPILRVISFVISAANLAWLSFRFGWVSDAYTQRATALETLKSELQGTSDEVSVNTPTTAAGAEQQDMRGQDVSIDQNNDISMGNCADGNLNNETPTPDPGCKTAKSASIGLPSASFQNMPSFGGQSLATDTGTIGRAIADYANGKGLEKSFESTNLSNSAIRNKTAKAFLKRAPSLAAELTGDPDAFSKAVKDEYKKRDKLMSAIKNSFPKSVFEQIKDPLKSSEEKEEKPKNQFAKPTKQEEFDFEMPSMPQQGFEEFGEDGVHDGELAAVNDDFADLASNADDIVKKDGVSIFKVIETRYKKSAYPRFFKRKSKATTGDKTK